MATQVDKVVFPTGDYIVSYENNVFYGTCTTAAATTAKVVTCNDFNELVTGATIHVKFTYQYTDSVTPTLNVNSTGAKRITVGTYTVGNMTLTKNPTWNNGQVVSFTYDGTNWCMNEYFERNTDEEVTQTEVTTDAEYEVIFAGSTGTTTRTEDVGKSEYFKFNPNKKAFTFGNRLSGSTIGEYSHAEGSDTTASSYSSHAEGFGTTASDFAAHAEGYNTTASGDSSHAEGDSTTANHLAQHVFGTYNISDPSTADATAKGNYVEIVGNGTGSSARSNARTLDWSGNEWLAGNLKVGVSTGSETTVMSEGVGGTDHQTNAGNFFLSVSGGGTGKPKLYLGNQGSNANTVSVTASDITLGGTSNTWDGTNTSLKDAIANIIDLLHPVGSIYMSLTDSTVAEVEAKFGGTWEKIESRFLLAASSSYAVNSTGGSADAIVVSHTHELAGTNAKAVDVSGHTHGHAGTDAAAVSNGAHTHTEYAGINEATSGLFTSITGTRSYPNTHIIGGAGKTSSNGAHTHSLTGNTTSAGGHGHSLTGNTKSSGKSGTGKNMPPYLAVYMYKRTA